MHQRLSVFGIRLSVRALVALLGVFMLVYYYTLMSAGFHRSPFNHFLFGLTFNSMLEHLLHGTFDVDPKIIGNEGFVYDGRTFSYFGILPALLRLPLILFHRLRTADVTLLSCVTATTLAGYFKVRAVIAAALQLEDTRLRSFVFVALMVAIVLGGPQVQFSKPSIYQEAVCWDDAFTAAFVYCAILGLVVKRDFSTGLLTTMATLAGLTLITRVSTAIGLYAATVLLVLAIAWSDSVAPSAGATRPGSAGHRVMAVARLLVTIRLPAALVILFFFALDCGFVNFERWGNPLIFAPLKSSIMFSTIFPERMAIIDRYGTFNIARLWYGLIYYFAPVWVFIRPDGKFLLYEMQQRLVDSAELPPSSLILSDPVLIALSLVFIWYAVIHGRKIPNLGHGAAILAGLAVPAILILMFDGMAFRYRIEFYPFLTCAAVLGFYCLCSDFAERAKRRSRAGPALLGCAIFGSGMSHVLAVLYIVSPLGPSTVVLGHGWVHFYRSALIRTLQHGDAQ